MTPWFMKSFLSPGDTVLYIGTEKTDPSITIQNNVIILNYQITLFVGKQCFQGLHALFKEMLLQYAIR